MPSLMAARWMDQNSGPIFAVCGLNCIELSLPMRECESVRSLQNRFPIYDFLLHSGDIRDQVSSRKVMRNRSEILMFWGCQISGGATQISNRIL